MSDIIDLDKPTGWFEVSVWHYQDGEYSVDVDRGRGRCTIWQTDNKDKAFGVAEYLEAHGRHDTDGNGGFITNEGEPFTGSIVHWDCSAVDHSS